MMFFSTLSRFALLLTVLLQTPVAGQDLNPALEIEILKRLDRNENGFLEPAEIPPNMRKFVGPLIRIPDADQAIDGTGRLDLELFFPVMQKHLQKQAVIRQQKIKKVSNRESLQFAAQLISLYDSNDDQHLEADEFLKLSSKWVECDLNQDLRLDVVEVACGLKYALNFPKNPDGTFDEIKSEADRTTLIKIREQMRAELAKQATQQRSQPASGNARIYAQSFLTTHDENQNGSLDSTELKRIGPSWLEVDFDGNGKTTVDEIQVRFQGYEKQRIADEASEPNDRANLVDSDLSKRADSSPAASVDFMGRDANRNGQIEMHEFATEFNLSVVEDFYQRDVNHDGVITSKEWNRFQASQNRKSAKPATLPKIEREPK